MARTPLYSRSPTVLRRAAQAQAASDAAAAQATAPGWLRRQGRQLLGHLRRHERLCWALGALLLAVAAGWPAWTAKLRHIPSFDEIDAAMRESIVKEPLPSAVAQAYEGVIGSVVRVTGERDPRPEPEAAAAKPGDKAASRPGDKAMAKPGNAPRAKPDGKESKDGKPAEESEEDRRSVGTGVVIVDKGLILTNLHVVAGADRIKVTFFDGSVSEAKLVSVQPEHDLAVLQATTIPDDLHAATMRSTGGLLPGDHVLAVGHPFGIGPSVSAGVVSGLKREFRSPEGKRILTNLIQFDAAANPGNSGGPLVTLDGHVVGIVTAIMNPTGQRTFIGIGFAVPIENAAAAAGMPPF
ncbi:MAG: S1C family serine protease [Aquabacterium sp.]